ncbi:MAG: type II toxin-antitoxin system VapC family toxin [Defluviitaleaceae bacterium]|nr:type II toxin-antitoxin system VapC family toxin [Defluviitaleaceae bacterium]
MKKLKIYLDTSIVSHLDAPERADWQDDTHRLWSAIQAEEYEVFLSPVVMAEIDGCTEPKLSRLLNYLQKIQYTELKKTGEVTELAKKYLEAGILGKKSFDDCQHIAYACVYNCDMLVSWNFKHLVNIKTISGVKGVNALAGYREMPIYTPTILISGGADDDS